MLPQIRLDRSGAAPLHQQLADELRSRILSGELPPGSRLPPTRRAGKELGVARNLVVMAYEQLQLEGYLRAAVGVGTWVPESLSPHLLPPPPTEQAPSMEEQPIQGVLSRRGHRIATSVSPLKGTRPTLPFRPAAVSADHFPDREWLRLHARNWRRRSCELVHYGEVQGFLPLREALADHLTRFRGVRTTPGQILITSGSQQSLDMVARMLIDPGDSAAVEEPGYDGAAAAFRAGGARLVPVPVDVEGLQPDSRVLRGVRLIYTTPSHQYPLGVTLSLERRLSLLKWAEQAGSWIIEDDYDSEFRYESRPLPSLQGLDRAGRVVYVGTFSKVLASALRIGFIVLPEVLTDPFIRARQVIDHHPPIAIQATLADFIAGGHLERHIARLRNIYRERRESLRQSLNENLGRHLSIVDGDGGLHLAAFLNDRIQDTAVCSKAFSRGIDPQPLSVHYSGTSPRNGLVLGFGGFAPDRLREAVNILGNCIEAVEEERGARVYARRERGGVADRLTGSVVSNAR